MLWLASFVQLLHFIAGIAGSKICVVRFGYTNAQIRSVKYNSVDIAFVCSAFGFAPPKEAENIAPGVNPGGALSPPHPQAPKERHNISQWASPIYSAIAMIPMA